jgi:DNA-binding transcriptional MerR regulator
MEKEMAFLSASQLALAVGMSVDEVEDLVDAGLLRMPFRGYHHDSLTFNRDHLNRLKVIKRALDHGFAIDEIRRLTDQHVLVTCRDVYEMAERNVPALRQRLGEDAPAVLALKRLMGACARRGGRRDCGIITALETGNL